MTSRAVSEARLICSDLRRLPLRALDPHPSEATGLVDDRPNPFHDDPPAADRYLRGLRPADDEVDLPAPGPGSWEQHVNYATGLTFRVMREAGVRGIPSLV